MKRMFARSYRQRKNNPDTNMIAKITNHDSRGHRPASARNGTDKTDNEITSLKIMHLLERRKYYKVVELLRELPQIQLLACLESFPFKFLNSSLPDSFPVWETLLTKVHNNEQEYVREFPYAACDELVLKIGHYLAHLEREVVPGHESNQELYRQCRRLLKKVYMQYREIVDNLLKENERVSKAIYSMNQHIPLGVDPSAVSLQQSILKEVSDSALDFDESRQRLEELAIENGHIRVEVPLPCDRSTQVDSHASTQIQVQQRLYSNQCVLGAIKPIKRQDNLPQLTEMLTTRVLDDKEVLAIFSNLRTEVPKITENDPIEPWLRKYQHSLECAITLLKEIQEELVIKPSITSTSLPEHRPELSNHESTLGGPMVKPHPPQSSSPSPPSLQTTQSTVSLDRRNFIDTNNPFYKRHSFSDKLISQRPNSASALVQSSKLSQSAQSIDLTDHNELEESTSVQDIPSTDQPMAGMKKTSGGSLRRNLRNSMRKLSSSAGSVSIRKKKVHRTSSNDSVVLEDAKKEILEAHETIQSLRKRERELTDRLSEQAQRQLQDSEKFEDILMGASRPNLVMQRYQDLYTQGRVEAYDAIADSELVDVTIVSEFLLDVLKMAYTASQCNLESLHNNWKRALHCTGPGDEESTTFKQLETAVSTYIRKVASSHNPKDILSMIHWDLDKKYGSLPCFHLIMRLDSVLMYIKETAKLSWDLVVQNPPMVLNCTEVEYVSELHRRFHTADRSSDLIVNYQWPTLIQDRTGAVLIKGVVVT